MKLALSIWLFALLLLFVVAAVLMNAEAHRGFWFVNA